jgi:ABC-type lipoprotein release transport system permease subunit
VVGEGLRLSLIAIGIGAVLALASARMLSQFLFGIEPFDLATFIAVAVLMMVVTAVASLLPAWRAAKADPSDRKSLRNSFPFHACVGPHRFRLATSHSAERRLLAGRG